MPSTEHAGVELPPLRRRSAWRRRTMNRIYDTMSGVMRNQPRIGDAALKAMYKSHLAIFKLSGGRLWNQMSDGQIMLLTTTGRRSGQPRTGPLLVLPWEDGFAICGSRGGTSKTPGWVHNLRADPRATLTVGKQTVPVLATEVVDDAHYGAVFEGLCEAHNGYRLYAAESTRKLPIFTLARDVPDQYSESDLDQFDHRGPLCMAKDPRPFLQELRERCPVGHTDAYGGSYFLTTYQDVYEASKNPQVYSSASGVSVPPHGMAMMAPIEYDPPLQTAFRSPLISRFSPRGVAEFEPKIRQTVHMLVDNFIERGEVEFASELARPLPAIVVSPVLGIPDEDREKVQGWAERIGAGGEGFDIEAGMASIAYFDDLYERRKREPADDLTTLVMNLDILGRPITKDEFLPMMVLLMTAGLDTTTSAAAYSLLYLAENPDKRSALMRDPGLIPGAVEELLRVHTPIPVQARTMLEPATIRDVHIPAGERVQLVLMSANFDPAEFTEPEKVDFERQPNRHFSFGIGVHRCLGAHLARLELKILLEIILDRIPDYRVDSAQVVRNAGVIRGINHLPATFTPGSRVG